MDETVAVGPPYVLKAEDADLSEAPDVIVEGSPPNLGSWLVSNKVSFSVDLKEPGGYTVFLDYSKEESVGDYANLQITFENNELGGSMSVSGPLPSTGDSWSNYSYHEFCSVWPLSAGRTTVRLESTNPDGDGYVMNLRSVTLSTGDGDDEDQAKGMSSTEADAEVTGFWLEIPDFPKDADAELETNDDDMVSYACRLDDGDLRMTILRLLNPDNDVTPYNVGEIVASIAGIDEDDIGVTASFDPDEDNDIPLFTEYPFAVAVYETEEDEEEFRNVDFFVFPEGEFYFWVRFALNEAAAEKYGDDFEDWIEGMRIVER